MNTYSLPIHLIRQYLFCPRVVYFLELLNIPKVVPIWVDEGSIHHDKQVALINRRTLQKFNLLSAKKSFNFHVKSESLHIHGQVDGFLESEDEVYPIEIKLSGKPTFSHQMQLCAYGMAISEQLGKKFEKGFLVYGEKGKTYTILCDNEKRKKVKKLIGTIITMIKDQKIPASSASEYQCSQCEFLNYCNDRF